VATVRCQLRCDKHRPMRRHGFLSSDGAKLSRRGIILTQSSLTALRQIGVHHTFGSFVLCPRVRRIFYHRHRCPVVESFWNHGYSVRVLSYGQVVQNCHRNLKHEKLRCTHLSVQSEDLGNGFSRSITRRARRSIFAAKQ
jgi:hypothetical protein